MSRTLPPLLALALIALLTACAQTGGPPVDLAADPGLLASPATPTLAPLLPPSAPAPAASAPSADDQAGAASIVIHGNDRLYTAQRPPDNPPAQAISRLQFENAPVGEVVNVMLRDLLKVDYVIHPPLNGAVTLTTRQTIDADRALLLLETALQANGIVMARDSRGTYHVGTPDALRGIVSAPVMAEPGKPLPPGYGAVIIPLEYLGAGEMANIMRPLISPDAILRVDTVRNILVMRGSRAETEGWLDLVKTFDVNLLRGMSVGVFPLKHTSATDVDAALRLLSGASSQAAGGGGSPAPAAPGRPAITTAPRPGMPATGAAPGGPQSVIGENNPLFGAVRILPIERLNAVMVVTPRAAYLDEIRYWIEQFDQPNINSGEPQLFVYKVQNGSAAHLAELINGIYGGVAPGQPGGPTGATGIAPGLGAARGNTGSAFGSSGSSFGGSLFGGGGSSFGGSNFGGSNFGASSFGGSSLGASSFGGGGGFGGGGRFGGIGANQQQGQQGQQGSVSTVQLGQSVRVMADNINNTMLIYATPNEYARIESTLKRLDVPRAQVLIEASIIEVTLTDQLQYGLQWAFSGGLGGHGYNGAGVLDGSAPGAFNANTFGGASGGFTYSLFNSAGQIKGVLNALASKSLVRVISNPSLMVLDNHTATIQVGDQIPISTGSTYGYSGGDITNNLLTTQIQYKDTGVILGVTPSVSAGDLVTLDIDQIVTDIGARLPNDTTGNPPFMQREINSQVAVRSGETMVLGGLIKDNASRGSTGLPILSSLPVVGGLFGGKTDNLTRTELLVILTPRVVRSDEEVRAVSRELRNRMSGLTAADLPSVPSQGVNQK